jgi:plastocyanin
MKRDLLTATLIILILSLAAHAGTISGKVFAGSGESVVYLDTVEVGTLSPPTEHPVFSQKGLMFQPHIMVVQAGTTVDFLNSDNVAHNVFWPSFQQGTKKAPGKNLGTWPQGEKKSYKFDQSGVATLLCNVHPEMSGYIIVVPTSHYALTDGNGNYKIDNVPDGQYSVVGWHEGIKTQTKRVAVDGDAKVDFTLSK